MTDYGSHSDVYVSADGDEVRWVDFGEIRHLSPEEAQWLADELSTAATLAKGGETL